MREESEADFWSGRPEERLITRRRDCLSVSGWFEDTAPLIQLNLSDFLHNLGVYDFILYCRSSLIRSNEQ